MLDALQAQIATLRARLLDTSTRNRLLNYAHPTRSCMRFVATSIDEVFGQLAAGRAMAIEPVPEPSLREVAAYWKAQGREDCQDRIPAERWARHLDIDTDFELGEDAAKPGQSLLCLHYRASQEALLRRVRSAARSAIEESGANLLFLSFGFLQWRDGTDDKRSGFLAPLLLLPVELDLAWTSGGKASFRLGATGEEVQVNHSLARKLDVDHGRRLPEPASGDDGPPERPSAYLARVRRAVQGLEGWTVRPYLTLGLFDFGSFLLWRDLDPDVWPARSPLTARPLIRQLIGGEPGRGLGSSTPPDDLDAHIDLDLPLVDRADGSQARALLRAFAGETMVVEGPPGTGKSQTITNLIAATIAQGKRVLFVSEKLAALDVVRRRMAALGLGEFCLELHSEKARKRALLDDLDTCLERRGSRPGREDPTILARLRQTRAELAAYGDALLATPEGFDQPLHRILARAAVLRLEVRDAGLGGVAQQLAIDVLPADRGERADVHATLTTIGEAMAALGDVPERHPWTGIDATVVQPFDRERVTGGLDAWTSALRSLDEAARRLAGDVGWSLGERLDEVRARCDGAITALERFRIWEDACDRALSALESIGAALACGLKPTLADLEFGLHVARLAAEAPGETLDWRREGFADPAADRVLVELERRLLEASELQDRAMAVARGPLPLGMDPTDLRAAADVLESAGPFGFLRPRVRRCRALAALHLGDARGSGMARGLRALAAATDARAEADSFAPAKTLFGEAFQGSRTDMAALRRLRAWVTRTKRELAGSSRPEIAARFWALPGRVLAELAAHGRWLTPLRPLVERPGAGSNDGAEELRHALLRHASPDEYLPLLAKAARSADILRRLQEVRDRIGHAVQAGVAFRSTTGLEDHVWFAQAPDACTIGGMLARNDRALAARDGFEAWLAYDLARRQATKPTVRSLVAAAESGRFAPKHLPLLFEHLLFDGAARSSLQRHPQLLVQFGARLDELARRFAELDEELMEARRESVASRLRAVPIPRGNMAVRVGELSEESLLRHEISKQKRHLPIRKLLERAGCAVLALKPCFMMGPYAIAQHLAPGGIGFDLLVVDEASQLKPEESLGALARADQAVIVGDTKQLPPTAFFERISVDDELDEDERGLADDAESIMEIAQKQLRGPAMLRWHYRSRHEALIAWSNAEFYDDELVVFPASHGRDPRYGIGWHHHGVGVFKAGRNEVEASAVVDAVIAHLAAGSARSLGVAAMNVRQAELIEELLDQRVAAERPDLVDRLERSRRGAEPFFVKNLENVQGDERDVMMISMTYGPESPGGKVPQRFGPINRETGWRRLNVLFTRARERMEIHTSVRASDVVAAGARRGIAALHSFLSYAETGQLRRAPRARSGEPESDFELAVLRALHAAGYACTSQLGFAGFRLDIVVHDPRQPDRYLLAVECDGATYHSSRSARERDRLRQDILEGLGWKVLRIWSTDWYRDPEREIRRIVTCLEGLSAERSAAASAPAEAGSRLETIEQAGAGGTEAPPSGDGRDGPPAFGVPDNPDAAPIVGRRTVEDIRAALVRLRDEEIHVEMPNADRASGLLRKAMLDSLLRHLPANRDEFQRRIPEALRTRTDPEQFRRYAPKVFDLLAEIAAEGP